MGSPAFWLGSSMTSYLEKAKQRQQKAAARLAAEPQAQQPEDSQKSLPGDGPGSQDCSGMIQIAGMDGSNMI